MHIYICIYVYIYIWWGFTGTPPGDGIPRGSLPPPERMIYSEVQWPPPAVMVCIDGALIGPPAAPPVVLWGVESVVWGVWSLWSV